MTLTNRQWLGIAAGLTLLMVAMASMTYVSGWQPGDPVVIGGTPEDTTTAPTPVPTTTTTSTPTTTLAPPTTTTVSQTQTTTTLPPLDASFSFPTCNEVRINASTYYWVGIAHADGSQEFVGDYAGARTFQADATIDTVYIASERGEAQASNPAFQTCENPQTSTPTTTTTRTPMPTTTTTTVTTTTTTTTATPTPTTTTRTTTTADPLREYKIQVHVIEEDTERGVAVYDVTNAHDDPVTVDFDVVWYRARDIIDDVNRHPLTLDPGETVRVESTYQGNESLYEIDHTIHNLERQE